MTSDGTKIRHLRSGPVWDAAVLKAKRVGTTVTAVLNARLEEFVNEPEEAQMNLLTQELAVRAQCPKPDCHETFRTLLTLDEHVEKHEPFKGMPATITLSSDRMAAVVVRVNQKEGKVSSVSVRRVKVDKEKEWRINAEAEPYPFLAWRGVIGQFEEDSAAERYAFNGFKFRGTGQAAGCGLILGRSFSAQDDRQ